MLTHWYVRHTLLYIRTIQSHTLYFHIDNRVSILYSARSGAFNCNHQWIDYEKTCPLATQSDITYAQKWLTYQQQIQYLNTNLKHCLKSRIIIIIIIINFLFKYRLCCQQVRVSYYITLWSLLVIKLMNMWFCSIWLETFKTQ